MLISPNIWIKVNIYIYIYVCIMLPFFFSGKRQEGRTNAMVNTLFLMQKSDYLLALVTNPLPSHIFSLQVNHLFHAISLFIHTNNTVKDHALSLLYSHKQYLKKRSCCLLYIPVSWGLSPRQTWHYFIFLEK